MNLQALEALLKTVETHSDGIVSFHFIFNGDVDGFQIYVSDKDDMTSYFVFNDTIHHNLYPLDIRKAIEWIKEKRQELSKPPTKLIHGIEVPNISLGPDSLSLEEPCYIICLTNPDKVVTKPWKDSYIDRYSASIGFIYPFSDAGETAALLHANILLGLVK